MLKILTQNILIISLVLMISSKAYPQWVKVPEVSKSSCILVIGDIILVGSDNGIYRSNNSGLSWSHFTLNNLSLAVTDLSKNTDYIFAGTNDGVYISADTGKTWRNLGLPYSILSVYANDSTVLACIQGGGLFRSENNGQDWTPIDGNHYYSYLLFNNRIFVGTFTGIYVSTDNGLTWDFADLQYRIITSLSQNYRYFFAANYTYGIYRSEDYGMSWSPLNEGLPLGIYYPYSVFAADSLIFAGLTSNKIYLSTNNGLNWQDFSDGININEETYHVKFAISGNKIFVSFLYNSLWYRDLSEITSITRLDNYTPDQFVLHQNYPNPFNPNTTIKFSIPTTSFIKLKVYNSIGQLIDILINKKLSPGYYSVNWNASKYPNGIYYYRFESDKYTITKKCVLIK